MDDKLTLKILKQNFVYPEIKPKDFRLGAIKSPILRPDGDWRNFLTPPEEQNRNGVESSSCYVEALQHAIATLQEERFGLPDRNYSARFNALLSDGTEFGGNPLKAADSFRHDGMIPDEMLPFSDNIISFADFHSFKGGNEYTCINEGLKYSKEWDIGYEIVFEKGDSIEKKYDNLREALTMGTVAISVDGWVQDENGVYIKRPGADDNHFTECTYLDDKNCPWIRDTYPLFDKKLEPFYNSDFAMRVTVKRKAIIAEAKLTWWEAFAGMLKCKTA